ncbi:MAG: flagellar biosynthetic protein FliO [Anaerolineae bacterium]
MAMRQTRSLVVVLIVALSVLAVVVPVCADGGVAEATAVATPATTLDYSTYLESETETITPQPSTGSLLVSLAWKLGLVVGLAYGALWVLRRFVAVQATGNGQQMQILETVSLGSNRSLHLLRIGSKALLIGATSQEMRALADVSQDVILPDEPAWNEDMTTLTEDDGKGSKLPQDKANLSSAYEAVRNIRRFWNGRRL